MAYAIEFCKQDVKEKNLITVNAPFPEGKYFNVRSIVTGVEKEFFLDSDASRENEMNNEGWDGEMCVRIYRAMHDHKLTLHIWNTPYDEGGPFYGC